MRVRRARTGVLVLVAATAALMAPALSAGAPLSDVRVADAAADAEPNTVEGELREFARRVPGTPTPPRVARQLPPPKLQCTSAGVEAFLRQYTMMFNRGRMSRVGKFFARKTVPISRDEDGTPQVVDADWRGFRWYTVASERRGVTRSARRYFIGRNRKSVKRYVRQRRRNGERLAFVATTGFQELQVGGAPHAGLAFLMKRRANDLLPRRRWGTVKGKALIDCQSGKISVFSI